MMKNPAIAPAYERIVPTFGRNRAKIKGKKEIPKLIQNKIVLFT